MQLPTVRVKRDGGRGHHLINKVDFNPNEHELFDAAPKEKSLTANEIKALLDEKQIEYKASASKSELQALLDAAPKE